METHIFNKSNYNLRPVEIIKDGGLVAIPTETVYGLAADAFNAEAVAKIFIAKGRPMDNPLIVHVADVEDARELVSDFPAKAAQLADKFWPGPLTMILPKSSKVIAEVTARLDTVAIRMPDHDIVRNFIRLCGCPLAAPSANISGKPSPTTALHVLNDLNGRIDGIIDGGECKIGIESTVVDVTQGKIKLLRPGRITLEELESVVGEIDVDQAVLNKVDETSHVMSPGLKYKHYSPDAKVIMVRGESTSFTKYVNEKASDTAKKVVAICFNEEKQLLEVKSFCYGKEADGNKQALRLFAVLREVDEYGAKVVYVHAPLPEGTCLAVYNRLIRAAGFDVVDV